MVTFSPKYEAPGAYVIVTDVAIPTPSAGATVLSIVGLGKKTLNYQQIITRNIDLATEGPLSHTPIFEIVQVTDGMSTFIEDTNFSVNYSTGAITWLDASASPSTGNKYGVTYTAHKTTADYESVLLSRPADIITYFGSDVIPTVLESGTATSVSSTTLADTGHTSTWTDGLFVGKYIKITAGLGLGQSYLITGTVAGTSTLRISPKTWEVNPTGASYSILDSSENTITNAAMIAVENGAGFINCTQVENDNATDWKAAIDKLRAVDTQIVVIVHSGKVVGLSLDELIAYTQTHVDTMSQTVNRKERIALFGAPAGTTLYSDFINVAKALVDKRCVYIAPSTATRTIASVATTMDGSYLAAALGGVICNLPDAGEPISGKSIVGFTTITDPFLPAEKNIMAQNGVLILENQFGSTRVRHALTTDTSTVSSSELKVTRIKDFVSKDLRDSVEKAFVNTRNLGGSTLASIDSFVRLKCAGYQTNKIIVSSTPPEVTANAIEPRQVDINVAIKPTLDINWILINLGVTL